jgi:hypothetical protein
MRRVELKILFLKSEKKDHEIALTLGWHPSKLSLILNGVYTPSSTEIEDMARVLGCQVDRIDDALSSGRREVV